MKPTRRAQPYRRGHRQPSSALAAMVLGKPQFMPNPQDVKRQTQRKARPRRRPSARRATFAPR